MFCSPALFRGFCCFSVIAFPLCDCVKCEKTLVCLLTFQRLLSTLSSAPAVYVDFLVAAHPRPHY